VNDKVYIHEYVDIIGHHRADYMHHMTANFSPRAQEERQQRCYGVWGVLGSTRRWPEVVNIWEEDGFDGLAASFRHECRGPGMQDPHLAEWWAQAAGLRRGGSDRLLAPAPWTRTIDELCADGVTGETYAHEQVTVPAGTSADYLEMLRQEAVPAYDAFGWELAGAWETLMTNDSECIVLWAIPTWEQWAELERGRRTHPTMARWWARCLERTDAFARFLLVDAPLSPFRTHRQPAYSDQLEDRASDQDRAPDQEPAPPVATRGG
jgi:hypothetical protein